MTRPNQAQTYDILGCDAEDVVDALPIPSGNYEIEDVVFKEDQDILGADDYDILGAEGEQEQSEQEPEEPPLPSELDFGQGVPLAEQLDQSVLENRPLLNFGGDLPDGVDQWDFGDEIPASSTEVYGDDGTDDDQSIVANRPVLNFGGDLPDAVDEWDFGDDIPAASTEVYGDVVEDEDQDILGGVEENPAFDQYLETRIASTVSLVRKKTNPFEGQGWRAWEISFGGSVVGPAGEIVTITDSPQCLFRGEKIMVTDSGSPVGQGTRIMAVMVGNKVQKPGGVNGTLSTMFGPTALANGITFDTADKWTKISMVVSFVQACTFNATIFGRAVLD